MSSVFCAPTTIFLAFLQKNCKNRVYFDGFRSLDKLHRKIGKTLVILQIENRCTNRYNRTMKTNHHRPF